MASSKDSRQDIFTSRVVPIMDSVRDKLNRMQAEEHSRHNTSFGSMLAGSLGPDGGMASMDAYNGNLRQTGEWTSKTVDDYIDMVKAELKKQNITVDAVMEKKMVDYLVRQQMPRSTAEYILRKAAEGSIFYIPQRVSRSSMQDHINKKGEEKYDPSLLEEVAGCIGSWLLNAASTLGVGGFFGQAAVDVSTEAVDRTAQGQQKEYLRQQQLQAKKEVADTGKRKANIPKWMLQQMGINDLAYATDKQLKIAHDWAQKNGQIYRSKVTKAVNAGERTVKAGGKAAAMSVSDATFRAMQYEAFAKAIRQEQTDRKNGKDAVRYSDIAEADEPELETRMTDEAARTNAEGGGSTSRDDYSGWDALFDNIGVSGMGGTLQHLGLTLSLLPDMLIGFFTGKSKAFGMNKETLMPLAALISGTFFKNPLLKIPLMLYGGAGLLNTAGKAAIADYRQSNGTDTGVRYKRYADEALDTRLNNPQIEGNILLVDIDNIPRLVTLPPSVVEAYADGALPINTIANRVLLKADQSLQSERQSLSRTAGAYGQRQEQELKQSLENEREQVKGIR